jgi:hypothetical protein
MYYIISWGGGGYSIAVFKIQKKKELRLIKGVKNCTVEVCLVTLRF